MPKARVFELAKELGMNHQELLDKLLSMGMEGMTRMSSLDEEEITRIRAEIDVSQKHVYEEKRVGRRVIRRRKKAVSKPEPETVGEPATPEELIVSPEAPSEAKTIGEEPAPEEVVETPSEKAGVEPEKKEPAEVPGEPTQEQTREPVHDQVKEEAPAEEPEKKEPVEVSGLPDEKRKEPEIEKKTEQEVTAKKKHKKAAAKKVRKVKKEEPAKIIKMPESEPKKEIAPEPKPPIMPEPDRKRTAKVFPIRPPEITPAPEEEKGRKAKKKKAKKAAKAEQEEIFASKKRFTKRREVLERADIYGEDRLRAIRPKKGAKTAARSAHKTEITTPKAIKRRIRMTSDSITVGDLAKKMGIKIADLLKKLLGLGVAANINQAVDYDTAVLVAAEFNYEVEQDSFQEEKILAPQEIKDENLELRPPVITVMGHVDHGKTTLLDVIRRTNVVEGEAGGITQHIGAYHVKVKEGAVTFLDTPGHEAFTSMRARGAEVTDLVILIVAADDGVMQQTKEAIDHATAAKVPLIVAINKIDKANADVERVKRELAEYGLVPEEWGGDIVMVPVSAKEKKGINELLEYVLLQTELLELKADPHVEARGAIIEARLDKGRGAVATVLIQSGTLRKGDSFVCGQEFGRVRAMIDDRGRDIEEAGPSIPVEVQGFSGVPMAGDEFIVLKDDRIVKQIAERRQEEQRMASLSKGEAMTLEMLYKRIQEGEALELRIILKADVQGSVEAVSDALLKLSTTEISINVIRSSTGAISENDVMLAAASEAIIIGFNVRPTGKIRKLAEAENVEMRLYEVIYELLSDVKEAMEGRLAPTYVEQVQGQAEVRQIFRISKVGTIAGCMVTEGKITRADRVRVIRDGVVVAEGSIESLKRFKDDAKEVMHGFDCGIHISNFNDVKEGDIIESYVMEEIKRTLE